MTAETETTEPVEAETVEHETEEVDADATDDNPDLFPRDYVEQIRREAAEHRTRAKDRDALAARLHLALTGQLGRLADPTDLPYDEAHLTDPATLAAAVDELLTRKPHLATRRVSGDVGQGATATADTGVDLAGMLRGRA